MTITDKTITDMTTKAATTTATLALVASFACAVPAFAQDLGPGVRKLADGVYAFVGENYNSNAGIVLTQDGVVLIDSGHNPVESRKLMEVVKKLTPMPVRLLIDTEPHPDHTTGHFVFSPPATIVAAAGAGDSMRAREKESPQRIQQMAASSPAMKTALEGYKFVPPHVEYQQRASLTVGERTIELYYMRGVHSEADTAVWLPKERVVFSASGIVNNQINILRPFVTIPDILAAAKLMKGLNPEHVVPGHGQPGTVKIFEDTEKYYALLIERVEKAVKEGKSLDDIKKEVKMPEYASWASQDRFPTNIEAAYKMVTGK
jgi:cyclase